MNYEKLLTSKQKLYLKNLYFTIKLRILNTVREQIKTDKKVDLNVLETELVLDNIKYNYFEELYLKNLATIDGIQIYTYFIDNRTIIKAKYEEIEKTNTKIKRSAR